MRPKVVGSCHETWLQQSLLKREKCAQLQALLRVQKEDRCLDLGGDNGVISAELRRGPGRWISADMAETAVLSCHELCGGNTVQMDGTNLPFGNETMDWIVVIDLLEHVVDDLHLAEELLRVLKVGGRLLLNVPRRAGGPLRWMAPKLGYSQEKHGHVRQGYTLLELQRLFSEGTAFIESKSYSRFFTQAIDLAIHVFMSLRGTESTSKGHIVTSETFNESGTAYRVYTTLLPLLRLISSMDRLLFFASGHNLVVLLRKTE